MVENGHIPIGSTIRLVIGGRVYDAVLESRHADGSVTVHTSRAFYVEGQPTHTFRAEAVVSYQLVGPPPSLGVRKKKG